MKPLKATSFPPPFDVSRVAMHYLIGTAGHLGNLIVPGVNKVTVTEDRGELSLFGSIPLP